MATPKIGDRVPSAVFKRLGDDGIEDISSAALFGGGNVLAIGVVGAFTPVCTARHLPEFLPYQESLTRSGVIDRLVCISVADPFVMKAWAEQLDVGDRIAMLTDTNAAFAEAMGLAIDLSDIGLGRRSTRYVLCAKDGIIDILKVEKSPYDLEETSAEAIRKLIMVP